MEKRIGLFGERYAQYVAEARNGLTHYEAAAKVAGVDVTKGNFVILAAGTSSHPEDGLWIVFFDPKAYGAGAESGAN